ncbi:MAG: GDSL-type esterase/lipase family protein [Deltaproteobacteria bacterium]|nr:GDSL-type esterase/lipase family protein [Deltaproteobacteria bacterium]
MPAGWWIEVGRFRGGPPPLAKSPDIWRLIAQGASTTEGFGTARDDLVWPALLERRLAHRKRSTGVEVINAGIGGSTTLGMLMNLKHVLVDYDPDAVLIYAGGNDATYSFGPRTERELYDLAAARRGPLRLADRLSMTRLLRQTWHGWAAAREEIVPKRSVERVPAVPLADFRKNLEEIAEVGKARGLALAFVFEAAPEPYADYPEVMAGAARDNGLPFLDASTRLHTCDESLADLFIDQAHYTAAGNRCVARILADFLEEENFLPEARP